MTAFDPVLKHNMALTLIVHANTVDEKTDPPGTASGRIACGVITKQDLRGKQ